MPDNGWAEWSKHVLLELKRLNTAIEEIKKDLKKVIEHEQRIDALEKRPSAFKAIILMGSIFSLVIGIIGILIKYG